MPLMEDGSLHLGEVSKLFSDHPRFWLGKNSFPFWTTNHYLFVRLVVRRAKKDF
jgi:hypothetical protein